VHEDALDLIGAVARLHHGPRININLDGWEREVPDMPPKTNPRRGRVIVEVRAPWPCQASCLGRMSPAMTR
jgi:hypothetical protein